MMFDWLANEIDRVNTPKFFRVDGPALPELRQALDQTNILVPPSYKEFVLRFGNADLYRQGSVYLVRVYASFRDAKCETDDSFYNFGRTDLSLAYYKRSLLSSNVESPIFEWKHEQGLRNTGKNFEEWLRLKCKNAKKLFTKSEWENIERGPPPFNPAERAIVRARRKYQWKVVGIANNKELCFEIHNGSDMILPYLSIGIKGNHGRVDGGVWLPVSSVPPGESRIIEKDCYKDLLSPEDVIAFQLPDPEPEDRDRYWEFK